MSVPDFGHPTPLRRVLELLPDAKKSGAGFLARCRAHDDRSPSLSVSEGRDGRVLVKCHAGCAQGAIVAALGLTMADLYPPRPDGASRELRAAPTTEVTPIASARPVLVKTYDYVDADGALLYQVCRFEPKTFRQRRRGPDGGWVYALDDVPRVLYRLPEVLAAAADGKRVFVVEGEKDADALAALGLVATTCAMGAGKWSDHYADALKGADVVLLPDNDDPGRAHADAVAAACLAVGCPVRVVQLPGVPLKGDVSDWLAAGGTLEALDDLVTRAPRVRIQKPVYRLDELWADDEIMRPPPPVVPYLAWSGRSTLLASAEKAGKSTLTGFVAAAVSRGAPFLDEPTQRGPVLLVGLEEFIGDAGRRLKDFGADPTQVFVTDRLPADPRERPQALRRLVDELRPVLVVIDSLIAYSDGAVNDAGSSAQMGPLVQQFTTLAHDTGAAVVLIHHARKQDGKYRDSSAIGGAVDLICEMFAPEEDADPSLRRLRSRGRVPARDVQFRYVDDGLHRGYLLAGSPATTSLEQRLLSFILANPGCGMRDVRQGVEGRNGDIDDTLTRLLIAGRVVDQGVGNRRSLRVSTALHTGATGASTAPDDPYTIDDR